MKSLKKLINNCTSLEILEIETTKERGDQKRLYLKPLASVMALDYLEGVLAVLSWNDGHSSENQKPKEEDPEGDGRGAKAFSIEFPDLWADDTEDVEEQ